MLGTLQKRPADELDYDVDFSKWLVDDDVITSATAVVTPTGGMEVQSVSIVDQVVKVWLIDGVDGSTYSALVTVATSGGRVKETEFKIRVRDC